MKTYLNQSLVARLGEVKHDLHKKKRPVFNRSYYAFLQLEKLILNTSGRVNNWGASVAKPALVGVGMIVGFGLYYSLFDIEKNLLAGMIASFDITTLVGYTRHATSGSDLFKELSYTANMFCGLWWYAIFVPTVINRISRVRA